MLGFVLLPVLRLIRNNKRIFKSYNITKCHTKICWITTGLVRAFITFKLKMKFFLFLHFCFLLKELNTGKKLSTGRGDGKETFKHWVNKCFTFFFLSLSFSDNFLSHSYEPWQCSPRNYVFTPPPKSKTIKLFIYVI